MANPIDNTIIDALNSELSSLTPTQVFVLAKRDFIELVNDELVVTKKAERALARHRRGEVIQEIRPLIQSAIETLADNAETTFRLDDVLKTSGLEKEQHRDNILTVMRAMRDDGLLVNHQGDNNFQTTWMRAPSLFSAPEEIEVDMSSVEPEPVVEVESEVSIEI